jgi:hypothetical protein
MRVGGGLPTADGRGGWARPGLPAPAEPSPPDWDELLERLDRLERDRMDFTNGKGETR